MQVQVAQEDVVAGNRAGSGVQRRASLIFVAGGILVALASVVVPLLLTFQLDMSRHVDISMMCGVLAEADPVCRAGAIEAGYTMLTGLSAGFALCVLFGWRYCRAADGLQDDWAVFWVCLLGVSVLLSAHIAWLSVSEVHLSRIGAITQQSTFISLENLAWPLLLQLMNSSRTLRFRFLYFSLLLPIIAMSPYRGVLFAVLVFGVVLPLPGIIASSGWKQRLKIDKGAPVGRMAAVVVALAAVLFMAISDDTRKREAAMTEASAQQDTSDRLAQRIVYPLFQAYFASSLARLEEVPSMWDEMLIKLRVAKGQNLNEMLYGKVYGEGTAGEMTSLYAGEAAANAMTAPFIWVAVAPLILVMLWLGLQRLGIEAGTLIGIAIWRGSLGGLATVLPALVIQLLILSVISLRMGRGGKA